jgi:hypothetical protein
MNGKMLSIFLSFGIPEVAKLQEAVFQYLEQTNEFAEIAIIVNGLPFTIFDQEYKQFKSQLMSLLQRKINHFETLSIVTLSEAVKLLSKLHAIPLSP